jgi:hypothetical protein
VTGDSDRQSLDGDREPQAADAGRLDAQVAGLQGNPRIGPVSSLDLVISPMAPAICFMCSFTLSTIWCASPIMVLACRALSAFWLVMEIVHNKRNSKIIIFFFKIIECRYFTLKFISCK